MYSVALRIQKVIKGSLYSKERLSLPKYQRQANHRRGGKQGSGVGNDLLRVTRETFNGTVGMRYC